MGDEIWAFGEDPICKDVAIAVEFEADDWNSRRGDIETLEAAKVAAPLAPILSFPFR